MSIEVPSPFVQPARPSGLSRRGLLKSGLGLAGVAGLVMPSTAAYAAAEAARDLIVTDYRAGAAGAGPMRTGSASPSSPICTPAVPIWGWSACARWSMPPRRSTPT